MAHPHVITHLFTEGTILATKRTGYAELVSEAGLEDKVRVLMKDQHKAMFLELRDGAHDEVAQKILALAGNALSDDHHVTPSKGDKSPLAAVPAAAIPKSPPPVPPQAKLAAKAPTENSGVRVIIPAAIGNKAKEQKSLPPPNPSPHPPAEPRRVPARSIFDTPDENGEFGESLISDKSLDEVILSYLTDDDLEV